MTPQQQHKDCETLKGCIWQSLPLGENDTALHLQMKNNGVGV